MRKGGVGERENELHRKTRLEETESAKEVSTQKRRGICIRDKRVTNNLE